MNKEEILYNKVYEKTKDFGRTHFVKEIMQLQRENKRLQEIVDKTNNELITLIQIIMEQPSNNVEEDNYLLNRLEGISSILTRGS